MSNLAKPPQLNIADVSGSFYFVKMEYKEALENLRQYNREYSTGNELLESVVACINYIVEDSENESKDDLLEWAEIVKNDLIPKVEQFEYTHCDFPHL